MVLTGLRAAVAAQWGRGTRTRGASLARKAGRAGAADVRLGGRLEPLEPRVLLSAYTTVPYSEALGLAGWERPVAMPAGEYVGFGHSAVGLGDLDGDGYADFAVSAPGERNEDGTTRVAGSVFIYSGRTREIVRTLSDGSAGFGWALANIGDVDADGVADLLVGSPWRDGVPDNGVVETHGAAYVFSGVSGQLIRERLGETPAAELGYAVTAIVDVHGAPSGGYIVGAPGGGGGGQGVVYVIDGATGQDTMAPRVGAASGDRFGHSLSAHSSSVSNLSVYIVGAPGHDTAGTDAGRVYIYALETGELRLTRDGAAPSDAYGTAVQIVGEALVVGAPGFNGLPGQQLTDRGGLFFYQTMLQSGTTFISTGYTEGAAFGSRIFLLGRFFEASYSNWGEPRTFAVLSPGADQPSRIRVFEPGELVVREINALGGAVFTVGDTTRNGVPEILTIGLDGSATLRTPFVFRSFTPHFGWPYVGQAPRVSPGGNYIWQQGPGGFLATHGSFAITPMLPGMEGRSLLAVNDDGVILAADYSATGLDRFVLVRNGEARTLSSLVTRYEGVDSASLTEPDMRAFRDGERLLFTDAGRAFLYENGTVTFLWEGDAIDMNADGTVLGFIGTTGLGGPPSINGAPVLRYADGTVRSVEGIRAFGLNDHNVVVGVNSADRIATWEDGVVRERADREHIGQPLKMWLQISIGNDGTIRAVDRQRHPHDLSWRHPSEAYYFFDRDGNRLPGTGGVQAVLADGRLVNLTGFGVPATDPVLADGTPVATTSSGATVYTAGVSTNERLLVFRTENGQTRRFDLGPVEGAVTDLEVLRDPATGRVHVLAIAGGRAWFFAQDAQGNYSFARSASPALAEGEDLRHFAGFTTIDGTVHLIASTTQDRVYLATLGQPDSAGQVWTWRNLSDTDLGGATVNFAADLTSYVAPWNGLNVAGVDENGHVQVVWYSPEAGQWRLSDLTESANGPTFQQTRLAAYVTPWAGLNVAGTDLDGNTVALWWVPQFGGQWVTSTLIDDAAIRLEPDSLTAYVTEWGGLNVVGRSAETGEIAVYWWTPQTGGWIPEIVQLRDNPGPQVVGGQTAAAASGVTLNMLARREADGHLVRLFWNPGDEGIWTLQDLTATAVA